LLVSLSFETFLKFGKIKLICFWRRRFGHGFGFFWSFGFPFFSPFWWRFEPFISKSEYLEMLKKYRDELKKELERIEEEIKNLEKEK